jgi:hypothetical protein
MKQKEKKVYEILPENTFPDGRIKSLNKVEDFSFYYYLHPFKLIERQTYTNEKDYFLEYEGLTGDNVGDTLCVICELGGKKLHKELIELLEDFYILYYSDNKDKLRGKLTMYHGMRQVLGFIISDGKLKLHYQNIIPDNREKVKTLKDYPCKGLENDDHIEIKGYYKDEFIKLMNKHWDRVNEEYDISYKEWKIKPKDLKRIEEEEREEERLYQLEVKLKKEFKLTKEQLKGELMYNDDENEYTCISGDKTFKKFFNGIESFRFILSEFIIERLKSDVDGFEEDDINTIKLKDGEVTIGFNYQVFDHVFDCTTPVEGTIKISSKDVMKLIKDNTKEIKTL